MLAIASELWLAVAAALAVLVPLLASAHVVLYKRDSRAAVLWIGLIWLLPVLGAVLYLVFGINRIHRRARHLRSGADSAPAAARIIEAPVATDEWLPADKRNLATLAHLVEQVTDRPLLPGNRVTPLVDGDEAYPAMLGAIDAAQTSVSLSTYIFDNDRAGQRFLDALAGAVARGVTVRVLIDDAGARYSWPSIVGRLRRAGIPVARFLPSLLPWRMMAMNLRNHRKILVVDGRIAFTGGINIRAGHLLGEAPRYPVQDLHCQLEGPVVAQLQEVFADDWTFCTGEQLQGEAWFPDLGPRGELLVRGMADGPDEDFERLKWVIIGALSCARTSVRVVTPYFLPDSTLITALNVAAMRGVQVDILLPATNNLPLVHWASAAHWWQVLERGCRLWLTPPPFDHSKLMLVDDYWALLGSANWDPRSLRLNFEFNIECYGSDLGDRLKDLVEAKLRGARRLTLADVTDLPLHIRLRNGVARLLTPYL